jgi:hypothetical protein
LSEFEAKACVAFTGTGSLRTFVPPHPDSNAIQHAIEAIVNQRPVIGYMPFPLAEKPITQASLSATGLILVEQILNFS